MPNIATGFPTAPTRDSFTNPDGTISTSWSQWLKAVTAVLGTSNESRLIFPAPYSTASATPVSTGFGIGPVQSAYTGSFFISGNILLSNSAGLNSYARLCRSTVGIPVAGNAPAGSDVRLQIIGGVAEASLQEALPLIYPDKNLAPKRYWYYLTLDAPGGGTATLGGNGVDYSLGGINVDEYY
jgi:hypothetical protein